MGFVKIASVKDMKPGNLIAINEGGKDVLAVNLDGKYYAIGNICTHKGCKLSKGKLKGESIQCPCHGSVFDVKSGRVLKGPAVQPQPIFQVKIENNEVLVKV
ncbi:MAG TPA: Rieske (2Fe-2S) protein [archaeon]|nr:Rieske (2Fe-2S) protein [archaeon]